VPGAGDDKRTASSEDDEQSPSSGRIAAWIGLAASLISLLAFFGVSDWSQLRQDLFHQHPSGAATAPPGQSPPTTSPVQAACELAINAEKTAGVTSGKSIVGDPAAYAVVLQAEAEDYANAADATADTVLQSYLRGEANALRQEAQALQQGDLTTYGQWGYEASIYTGDWQLYCERQQAPF
jgi:hypothetical protein